MTWSFFRTSLRIPSIFALLNYEFAITRVRRLPQMADMRAEMRDLETRLTRATAAEARLAHKLELATAAAASTPALATPTPTPSVRHTATPGAAAHDGSRRQSGDSAAVESSESSSGTEASAKLKDYRRECGELRRELQRAMAALAKEVSLCLVLGAHIAVVFNSVRGMYTSTTFHRHAHTHTHTLSLFLSLSKVVCCHIHSPFT